MIFEPNESYKIIVLKLNIMINSMFFRKAAWIMLLGNFLFGITSCNFAENDQNDISYDSNTTDLKTDTSTVTQKQIKPVGPKPDWAPSITENMLVVIEKLKSYNTPPIEKLSAREARKQPSPATAVMDIIEDNNIPVPASIVDTIGVQIPVDGQSIHARIYTPHASADAYPVIVYYHGGGWVIADLNTYDASAKAIAEQTGAVVVSVHYRQGPEHKFPTAHNDAFAAYKWVLENAVRLKADTNYIAVAGESAGGNLACNVSIMARDKGLTMPKHQVLVYPVTNNDMNNESYKKYATAKPLNKPMMEWFAKNYLQSLSRAADPRIALVKANLTGLPSTTIVGAEIDPLQSEGKLLADKLKQAKVEVEYKLYEGVTHEFFGMAAVVPEAKDAQALVSNNLKKYFK